MRKQTQKWALGQVFISHSSKDKRFVRSLTRRLWREGYQVWLDEKELVPGDALATRLSEALRQSRVVIVVVTPNSVSSQWLAFELNQATGRMVQGDCRVVPVLRGEVDPPPELASLLYADFRKSFAHGLNAVLAALERESEAAVRDTWAEIPAMIHDTFDSHGHVSELRKYGDGNDYNLVWMEELRARGFDDAVVYDVVHDYGARLEPLEDSWWSEYLAVHLERPHAFRLVVSARPARFSWMGDQPHGGAIGTIAGGGSIVVAVVDLTYAHDRTEWPARIRAGKKLLAQLSSKLRAEHKRASETGTPYLYVGSTSPSRPT